MIIHEFFRNTTLHDDDENNDNNYNDVHLIILPVCLVQEPTPAITEEILTLQLHVSEYQDDVSKLCKQYPCNNKEIKTPPICPMGSGLQKLCTAKKLNTVHSLNLM